MPESFYPDYDRTARQAFPSLSEQGDIDWTHLVAERTLTLDSRLYAQAERAVRTLFALSRKKSYRDQIPDPHGLLKLPSVRNDSVLMAYDFHSDDQGRCYLVEVNTNASGFLLAATLTATHRHLPVAKLPESENLAAAFRRELECANFKPSPEGAFFAIVDENLRQQKMLTEFFMYRDWLGGPKRAQLLDSRDAIWDGQHLRTADGRQIDFVYNRTTDFYLTDPAHSALRQAYLAGAAVFSPNPREYLLLADKQRLIEWSDPKWLAAAGADAEQMKEIEAVLIPTFEKSAVGTPPEIWAKRRSLFFKPKNSFGGKSVYRGASVSRGVFDRLMKEDTLIQRYTPAGSLGDGWKFDLRFYVYRDQIQMVVARTYRGQVTNFATAGGGFTFVQFSPNKRP